MLGVGERSPPLARRRSGRWCVEDAAQSPARYGPRLDQAGEVSKRRTGSHAESVASPSDNSRSESASHAGIDQPT
ncbi:hypothetical protein ACFPRL_18820 [Pseudoclavibacter helvolus]